MNLNKCGINFKVANELIPIRAKTHESWHPNCKMICGDVTDDKVKMILLKHLLKQKLICFSNTTLSRSFIDWQE